MNPSLHAKGPLALASSQAQTVPGRKIADYPSYRVHDRTAAPFHNAAVLVAIHTAVPRRVSQAQTPVTMAQVISCKLARSSTAPASLLAFYPGSLTSRVQKANCIHEPVFGSAIEPALVLGVPPHPLYPHFSSPSHPSLSRCIKTYTRTHACAHARIHTYSHAPPSPSSPIYGSIRGWTSRATTRLWLPPVNTMRTRGCSPCSAEAKGQTATVGAQTVLQVRDCSSLAHIRHIPPTSPQHVLLRAHPPPSHRTAQSIRTPVRLHIRHTPTTPGTRNFL